MDTSWMCVASTDRRTMPQPQPDLARQTGEGSASPSSAIDWSKASPRKAYRSVEWSADGKMIVTLNDDWRLRTFVLPDDLSRSRHDRPVLLQPHSVAAAARSNSAAVYPQFNLLEPTTAVILQSQHDQPTKLINALDLTHTQATYRLVDARTEQHVAPTALAFTPDGLHFVAGARQRIAVFDLTQDGSPPLTHLHTRSGRRKRRLQRGQAGTELAGIVLALAVNADLVLAAGTTEGQLGLWSSAGRGEQIMSFDVENDDAELHGVGRGIGQIRWSPCGRYLFVAKRQSDSLYIYDVRQGRRLSYLAGRNSRATLPLKFAMAQMPDTSLNVWAGGTDGIVRTWRNVTAREGLIKADQGFVAHDDVVTAVAACPDNLSLMATCSGGRPDPASLIDCEDSDDGERILGAQDTSHRRDYSVKIWVS